MPTGDSQATPISVWLVEDHETLRETVARVIDHADGIACERQFESCEAALDHLGGRGEPDVILLDLGLPGMGGIAGISRFKERVPDAEILVFSVFDDNDKIFRAICAGASGYLLKSPGMERIPDAIREVLAGGAPMNARIARRVLNMFSQLAPKHKDYGLSAREQEVLELMVDGLLKKEIADRLGLSFHTVDNYLRGIYKKLHVNSMSGAVAKALKEGLC